MTARQDVGVELIDPHVAAAAIAVLRGARSVREVLSTYDRRSTSAASSDLWGAYEEGLVDWDHRKNGSLRPTVRIAKVIE